MNLKWARGAAAAVTATHVLENLDVDASIQVFSKLPERKGAMQAPGLDSVQLVQAHSVANAHWRHSHRELRERQMSSAELQYCSDYPGATMGPSVIVCHDSLQL